MVIEAPSGNPTTVQTLTVEPVTAAADLRFEDALGFFPEDRLRWVACRDARLAAVVRAWLEANDVEPTSAPPRRYR